MHLIKMFLGKFSIFSFVRRIFRDIKTIKRDIMNELIWLFNNLCVLGNIRNYTKHAAELPILHQSGQ